MSITYPEAPTNVASKRNGEASIMNSGSALFPNGATGVYERAAKARSGKSMPLAWVAAPVVVVLIGGAVFLSATHQAQHTTAAPSVAASTAVVAPAAAPTSLKVQPATPIVAQTTRVTHVQTSVKTTAPAPHATATPRVTRTTTVARSVSSAPTAAAPTQAIPAAIVPAQAPTASTPTPGSFAFTPSAPVANPAANTVTTTPDTVTPAAPAPAPSSDAQPAPQA